MQGRYKQLESVPVLLIDDIGCEPERCEVFDKLTFTGTSYRNLR